MSILFSGERLATEATISTLKRFASTLSVTFALDCCDREAIGWVASPSGYSGDDVRDLMLESVEKRFAKQLPTTPVQWLSENGSAYTSKPELNVGVAPPMNNRCQLVVPTLLLANPKIYRLEPTSV